MPLHHLFFAAVYASRRLRKADFQTHSEKEMIMYSTTNHNAKTNKNPIGVPPYHPQGSPKSKGKKRPQANNHEPHHFIDGSGARIMAKNLERCRSSRHAHQRNY